MKKIKLNDVILHNADCLEVLKNLKDDVIDLIVTDPPYGLSFMGKKWDKALPSVEIWKECFRVMKPGSFAFIMCIPRQDCLSRMIVNVEEAGFNTNFTSIYWTYANGFPKAMNMSKMIEKRFREPDSIVPASGVGFMNDKDDGYHNTLNREVYDEIKSEEAKKFNGAYAGFQPKPAVEIILVVMKLLSDKNYIEQVLKNGKGVTWLDSCRIPYESKNVDTRRNAKGGANGLNGTSTFKIRERKAVEQLKKEGRFPANLLVSHDILNDGISRKSGKLLTHHKRGGKSNLGKTFEIRDRTGENADFGGDSGSYSRFFDLDKWFEVKLKELPESVQKTFPFLIVPKASQKEKNKGLVGRNPHPTIKPLQLMNYLISLGSRPGDKVLDPFMGSGTTGIACSMLGRKFRGIELDEEYFNIAVKRIEHTHKTLSDKGE